MTLDWRDTLKTLLPQFEARAVRSTGLNHLLVEDADDERGKAAGPSWLGHSTVTSNLSTENRNTKSGTAARVALCLESMSASVSQNHTRHSMRMIRESSATV